MKVNDALVVAILLQLRSRFENRPEHFDLILIRKNTPVFPAILRLVVDWLIELFSPNQPRHKYFTSLCNRLASSV